MAGVGVVFIRLSGDGVGLGEAEDKGSVAGVGLGLGVESSVAVRIAVGVLVGEAASSADKTDAGLGRLTCDDVGGDVGAAAGPDSPHATASESRSGKRRARVLCMTDHSSGWAAARSACESAAPLPPAILVCR